MSNNNTARGLYKTIAKTKTHLVQSREIATTCVCPYLFKMSYPFGVSEGERDYLAANTVHDVMSIALPTTILDNWQEGVKKFEWISIAEKIEKDSEDIVEKAISNAQEKIKTEEKTIPSKNFNLEGFRADVEYRFHGLLVGIAKRLMTHYERPKRALTEVTISNVNQHHEGRLDAALEFYQREYGVIDWKTNNMNQASTGGKDRWQLISNILLANYRYSGNENNWNRFRFGSVIYHQKAYLPDLPIQQDWIDKVKNDRQFAYEVLCGGRPHTQKPQFCPICDKGGESSSECQFYRKDSRLAYEGKLPAEYVRIRGQLIKRRYLVLDERAETHKHKFVIQTMINNFGEKTALEELESTSIIYGDFKLDSIEGNSVILTRNASSHNTAAITFLEPRKVVRIIGIEKEDSIPLLASVSEKGFVKEVYDSKLVIDLDGSIAAERAKQQLSNLPLTIIPDEINLTRRVLEPMHRFHKLAADVMLPPEL
ncbi:MAG: hypothetical protein M3297_06475 [Thermoproteota archaeon]|nr:hypothetical protein [Thermoproteota archaeon]